MTQDRVFVVTDMEANGLRPGEHSMLSLASVAIAEADGAELSRFSATLEPLPELTTEPATMAWWAENPVAYATATRDPRPAAAVIAEYVAWVRALPGQAVFVGQPLIFDGGWVAWYLWRFAGLRLFHGPRPGKPLFEGGGVDLASLAMGATGRRYAESGRSAWPEAWYGDHAHSHCALDDALGYAAALRMLLVAARR
ncbi:MAG: hypothetical protein JWP04_3577 [Belnapia sp.]|nr:hypothetical protein [Belnapia sp.]